MTLRAWISELEQALDLETAIDERLVLDVARETAHKVVRPAAPVSTFLLGYAAALAGGSPEKVEELAARTVALAARWEAERTAPDGPDESPAPPA